MKIDFPHVFFNTPDGLRFCVREIDPSDKGLLQSGFNKLSEKSKYLRFLSVDKKLSDAHLKYLTEVDGIQHVAWGIVDVSGDKSLPVGMGRFVKFKDEQDVAEAAITIIDSYQGKGLGQLLFATLNIIAGQIGLKKLRCYVLHENSFVLNALKQFSILNQKNEDQGLLIDIKVIPSHQTILDDSKMKSFMIAMKKIEEELGI